MHIADTRRSSLFRLSERSQARKPANPRRRNGQRKKRPRYRLYMLPKKPTNDGRLIPRIPVDVCARKIGSAMYAYGSFIGLPNAHHKKREWSKKGPIAP